MTNIEHYCISLIYIGTIITTTTTITTEIRDQT